MSKIYSVKITVQAQRQMKEIVEYIRLSLQAPDAALRLVEDLENAMNSLKSFPHRIRLVEEEDFAKQGVRKMTVRNYLVYFWIDEVKTLVQIIAIVYAKRNPHAVLEQLKIMIQGYSTQHAAEFTVYRRKHIHTADPVCHTGVCSHLPAGHVRRR